MTQKNLTDWHTWAEITLQPAIWRAWGADCDFDAHRAWVAAQDFDEVWFCGAGTSAYIGDILSAGLDGQCGPIRLRSVPSTDLVALPQSCLAQRKPLVVSFGRSGNSSESIGTLDALDALAPQAPRLNITCNRSGTLATRGAGANRVIVLPEATHDRGFAMTSSFSTMLLTALSIFAPAAPDRTAFSRAADEFERIFPLVSAHVGPPPQRAVFLGTGALTFAARESALKVMELSAGRIPCLWDSVLGFRHGPKSFVTAETRVFVLTSDLSPASRYEADLVAELTDQFPHTCVTTVGPNAMIDLGHPDGTLWAAPNAVMMAQVAGAVWAHDMGLNVDNPFDGLDTLTRVVSGVRLYGVGA